MLQDFGKALCMSHNYATHFLFSGFNENKLLGLKLRYNRGIFNTEVLKMYHYY